MHPSCIKFLLGVVLANGIPHGLDSCYLVAWASYMTFSFLYFPARSSVLWCLRRLIWAACRSPATCLIWHAVAFGTFQLFGKLSHLACRELFQIYTSITDGLGNKLFIMQEKPEDVPLQDLSCLRGVFS